MLFLDGTFARSQTPSPAAWPFNTPSPVQALASSTPPPQNPPLQEKSWAQLSQPVVSPVGASALAIKPNEWKHAETENFILHYRRVRDADNVASEIEFHLWFVAKELGATKDQYARKSHVYIFKEEPEWRQFLATTSNPSWSYSFAHGDELYLQVRADNGAFDAENLAHETTHAVVARFYRGRHWPLWLNEGFAEYMGRASVAARHSQTVRRNQAFLRHAEMSVAELTAISRYPTEREQVHELYETAEKFVRYLYNRYPPALFPKFVAHILAGEPASTALAAVYGAEFSDMAGFERKFAHFNR
ncbi:MAG: hypothetical protein M3Y86_12125 [Verrucomicrobiota bacterium]|nr:hypothetical protein [Verrucomicrobiota bacterium]